MNTIAPFAGVAAPVMDGARRAVLPLLLAAAFTGADAAEISESVWGRLPDGREVRSFVLANARGTRVVVAEYGALLVSVETADKESRIGKVTLSYATLEEALGGGVFGSVIGRFANRIGGGGFEIDGQRHQLASVNKDGVHIHGGATGFHRQLWRGEVGREGGAARVVLTLTSPDGHEGYPGEVEVSVAYALDEDNVLSLDYRGRTDRPTHLNLTNHAYFNLAGGGDVLGHRLRLDCGRVLETDPRKVPSGRMREVAGTPFDFREAKPLGRDIEAFEGGGYDHCFAIDEAPGDRGVEGPRVFAKLSDPVSGRFLEVATTKPGVQVFTANSFSGNPFPRWGGICFETQFYPDSPNRPEFPSSLLRPGEEYRHRTEFRFGVEQPGAEGSSNPGGAADQRGDAFVAFACELVPLPGDQVSFRHEGVELTRWHFGREAPGPFFYPFNGSSGETLTRMGHPGAQNHDHHRSIRFADAKVDGIDFWSENTSARIRQKLWQAYQDGVGEEAVFGKRAAWMDYSGPVVVGTDSDRRSVVEGLTFFDHPGNPRHPVPWHVRADGWLGGRHWCAFLPESGRKKASRIRAGRWR